MTEINFNLEEAFMSFKSDFHIDSQIPLGYPNCSRLSFFFFLNLHHSISLYLNNLLRVIRIWQFFFCIVMHENMGGLHEKQAHYHNEDFT